MDLIRDDKELIMSLATDRSHTYHRIHPRALQETDKEIEDLFFALIQSFLELTIVLLDLKIAHVFPLFNTGE